MATLLHIDSSARRLDNPTAKHNSISKALAARFIEQWLTVRPDDHIIYRDLGQNPPEFISQEWIAAVFTPEKNRTEEQISLLALSDTLIHELEQADLILMAAPMYNYGMPAALKAWFDQVIRINKTFTFDLNRGDYPLEPIMSGKKLVLLSSTGEFGFGAGENREKMNHLGPHVKVLGTYLGVEDFFEVRSEYQEFGDRRHQNSLREAQSAAAELARQLARTYQ